MGSSPGNGIDRLPNEMQQSHSKREERLYSRDDGSRRVEEREAASQPQLRTQ
jgi:hypothetical protein